MPALVPSAGITMDERIRNLMNERGHKELLMHVDDPDLEERTLAALDVLDREASASPTGLAHGCAQFEIDGAHGVYFEEEVQRRYPEFPTRGRVGMEDYLPPMSEGLRALVKAYG